MFLHMNGGHFFRHDRLRSLCGGITIILDTPPSILGFCERPGPPYRFGSNLSSAGAAVCFHLGEVEWLNVDCFSLGLEAVHVCIPWDVKSFSLCGFSCFLEFVYDCT